MLSPFGRRRRAFTLIELLVVIGIVVLLIGLLLPAVQKVREAAARTQCQNNLKQIGLALHSYANDRGWFPAAYQADGLASGPGWGLSILPYLEQDNLARQVPPGLPLWSANPADSANAPATRTRLKVFRCPSDRGPDTNPQTGGFAVSNYRATCGNIPTQAYPAGQDLGGVMYQNSRTTFAQVTDGTSNTFLVGEGKYDVMRPLVTGNALSSALWAGMTGTYPFPGVGTFVWIDNVMWPTSVNSFAPPSYVDSAFNSNHTGIVGYLFADGSVRSIAAGIDPAIRTQFGIRNDGLPTGNP